jgi:hypothetical protein
MNKLILFFFVSIIVCFSIYIIRRPDEQMVEIEGTRICLNRYYSSQQDIPINWNSISSEYYRPNGEFYFDIFNNDSSNFDSLVLKYNSIVYINNGYLKKVILLPKDDRQFLQLGTVDSIYSIDLAAPNTNVVLSQNNGPNIYLNDVKGRGVEITMDAP